MISRHWLTLAALGVLSCSQPPRNTEDFSTDAGLQASPENICNRGDNWPTFEPGDGSRAWRK